jgi:hypothetical protein
LLHFLDRDRKYLFLSLAKTLVYTSPCHTKINKNANNIKNKRKPCTAGAENVFGLFES